MFSTPTRQKDMGYSHREAEKGYQDRELAGLVLVGVQFPPYAYACKPNTIL